jgi:hypothetical protein
MKTASTLPDAVMPWSPFSAESFTSTLTETLRHSMRRFSRRGKMSSEQAGG